MAGELLLLGLGLLFLAGGRRGSRKAAEREEPAPQRRVERGVPPLRTERAQPPYPPLRTDRATAPYPPLRAERAPAPPYPPLRAERAEEAPSHPTPYVWPIDRAHLARVGQGLGADRGDHRHKGRDLFGRRTGGQPVPVVFPVSGVIRGVYDWRDDKDPVKRRAGLTIEQFELDERGERTYLWRFLHLGTAAKGLRAGATVAQGALVGTLAPPGTSGIARTGEEHLHLERRRWPPPKGQTYGEPLDPIAVLPALGEGVPLA